jgi:hypothetical protein
MVGCHLLLRRMVGVFVLPVCRLTHALLLSSAALITSLLQVHTVSDVDMNLEGHDTGSLCQY